MYHATIQPLGLNVKAEGFNVQASACGGGGGWRIFRYYTTAGLAWRPSLPTVPYSRLYPVSIVTDYPKADIFVICGITIG
jgi:hypothetical protein